MLQSSACIILKPSFTRQHSAEAQMATQDSVDISPDREVDGSTEGSLISVDEYMPRPKSVETPTLIYALMAYYTTLLIGCIAVIAFLTWKYGPEILPTEQVSEQTQQHPNVTRVLASMAFLLTGALVGSVLYQIRMLFRSYIKLANFDPRWLPKYLSAPVEAAGLALAIASLIEGGAIVLGDKVSTLVMVSPSPRLVSGLSSALVFAR
jgi:hypothetical protein